MCFLCFKSISIQTSYISNMNSHIWPLPTILHITNLRNNTGLMGKTEGPGKEAEGIRGMYNEMTVQIHSVTIHKN